MLTPIELTELILSYGPTIDRVSRQVARQYNMKEGEVGHGWQIIEIDDLKQEVILQLATNDMSVEALDTLNAPQAWIRTTARQRARTVVRKRSREVTAWFSADGHAGECLNPDVELVVPESTSGLPELEVLGADTRRRVRRFLAEIIRRVLSVEQRRAVVLYYMEGLDGPTVAALMDRSPAAVRKMLERARRTLGSKAEAALRAWREVEHPHAKRPQTAHGVAADLRRLLE